MVRLDLSYFYRLGASFDEIKHMSAGTDFNSVWLKLYDLKDLIVRLITDDVIGSSLRGAVAPGRALIEYADTVMARQNEDAIFSVLDRNVLAGHINRFEIVFVNEIAVAAAYFVVDKKPYSTMSLVAEGEALFPIDLPRKAPEAVIDLREAGKCLAFELPTAVAFHIHRAIEAILRRYWECVTGNRPKPKPRNVGIYLTALKKLGCGDEKVIAALEQLKDLHRNVVIHPEENLSSEDAIALVGMANSVAAAMLKQLPFVQTEIVPPDDQSFPAIESNIEDLPG